MAESIAPNVLAACVDDGALRELSEHTLAHAVMERLADSVLVFDRSWRFVYVNARGEQLVGCERHVVLGRVVDEVFPAFRGSPFARAYERAMALGEEVALTAWSGTHRRWYEVRALPTPAALIVLARDVTSEKTAEAERDAAFEREREQRTRAEEACRAKDELLAVLSRQLGVPIPAAAAPEVADDVQDDAPPSGVRGVLTGACILVVDDDQDSRDLLVAVLEHEGARVVAAASAADAFVALASHRPDVLVCDIGMPGQDGYAFMRQLRAAGEARGGWVPAIALTGYAREEDSRAALLAGFQMHVSKPVEPATLVTSIARLWRRRRDGATPR
jgi:PAS domain S-box-containing protein